MSLPKKLVEKLKDFGFTGYQSKAYLALGLRGVMSASETAKASGIPKSKIYDTLRYLTKEGMLEEYPGSPKMYKARPIENVIDEIIEKEKNRISRLEEDAEEFKRISDNLRKENEVLVNKDDIIWTVDGRRAFHEKMAEMVSRSKEQVLAVSPRFSRHPLIDKMLNDATEREVDFKGVTKIGQDNVSRVMFYGKYMDLKTYPDEIPLTILIVDGKECLYRMEYNANGRTNYVGVHSKNKGLVKTFSHYWETLWNGSEEIDF